MEPRNLCRHDIEDAIAEIFDKNERFCSRRVEYLFDYFSDDGETTVDLAHKPGSLLAGRPVVSVGMESLCRHASDDGMVRDKDAVWCVQQAFHESAHLWQYFQGYVNGYNREDLKDIGAIHFQI